MTVHMGYYMTQKGYILYDLETKKLVVSMDVIFREDVFPFKNNIRVSCDKLFIPASTYNEVMDIAKMRVTHKDTIFLEDVSSTHEKEVNQ